MKKRTLGRILILFGVSMWIPYAVLKYGMGYQVDILPFLMLHLLGVIPGAILAPGETVWARFGRVFKRGTGTTDSQKNQNP